MRPQLSYSQIVTWQRCRQRWYWTYIQDLVPKQKSLPLMVGDLTHLLREKFLLDKLSGKDLRQLMPFVKERFPDEDEDTIREVTLQAAVLVGAYVKEYDQDDTVKIVSPEVHLVKDFESFSLYARIDGLATVKDVKGIWREELKTTSRTDSAYLNGLRAGLQTGIALWLLEDLNPDEDIKGTVFSLIVKTKTPKVVIQPVVKAHWLIDFAKETVHAEAHEINIVYDELNHLGETKRIWKSSQCHQYNRQCSYQMLCQNDNPQNREAFFTSRSEQKERSLNQQ